VLKGATNEKPVRNVRALNPSALIVAAANLLSDVGELDAAGTTTSPSPASVMRMSCSRSSRQLKLLQDKRTELDLRLSERREVL
jgi:hypothetical protein